MKVLKLLLISLMGFFYVNTAFAVNLPGPLVETDWLANNLNKVMILDIRNDVKSFTKNPVFKKDK